ncbi:peptidoglycan editing factor PgeF [Terriglobus aquaticus]|uniref:Purine nucleoside phosphorylase n=1 Tax=Terriglobus aquaticus TaxID=940139 RepID=A0ABW9KIG3_9BACT|nr:peptidoglycan editing factor PgeF [Terriglobus aquaticus]
MARKQTSSTKAPSAQSPAPSPQDLESPEAIAVVDDILAGVGLTHGTRSSRRGSWAGGERKPVGRKKAEAERAAAKPKQRPLVLRSPMLDRDGLIHGFSTRQGGFSRVFRPGLPAGYGDLNLGFTKQDDPELVRQNRSAFLKALGASGMQGFGLLQQKHTPVVRILNRPKDAQDDFLEPAAKLGDALMTDVPGILLTVQAADCTPVLLFDPVRGAIAAIHAGWRGTLARIVERAVGTMRLRYGSDPADVLAAIGPSVGPDSYAVGEEVRHEFESQFAYAPELFHEVYESDPIRDKYPLLFLTARAPGHSPIGPQLHLDLWEANRRQLLDAGVREHHIHVMAEDTAADTGRFFSYRAEQGFTGRMMAAIGLAAQPAKGDESKRRSRSAGSR